MCSSFRFEPPSVYFQTLSTSHYLSTCGAHECILLLNNSKDQEEHIFRSIRKRFQKWVEVKFYGPK